MTTDYLSDEDAERMVRAWFELRDDQLIPGSIFVAVRRAWAARPSTARALDDAALDWQTRKTVTPDALVLAAHKRGIEITK